MRIVYFTLGLFILLNIGATCRTPTVVAAGCEAASGLVRCEPSENAER